MAPKVLPGWYVIEQFFPDGSAQFGVSQFTQTPTPPANQVVYGTWPTRDAAERAINDGTFRLAPHVYRGGNVSAGPGTTVIPGIQAPGIPKPFSWIGALAHWIGKLVLDLTDAHMWISLGWLLLGLLLITIGAYLVVRLSEPYARANQAVTSTITKLK